MKNKTISFLAQKRTIIQIILGVLLYIFITIFNISIWWVVIFGSLLGLFWGKVFCRWMCPIGILMEFMMKKNPDEELKGMYQYHKIGCPIAWFSGFLNRVSLYKIKVNRSTCTNCGLCDKNCYMPSIEPSKFSLYKVDKLNPSDNYSCSKCLSCVDKCPNGSLSFKPSLNNLINK